MDPSAAEFINRPPAPVRAQMSESSNLTEESGASTEASYVSFSPTPYEQTPISSPRRMSAVHFSNML